MAELQWVKAHFDTYNPIYKHYDNYYEGDHFSAFSTQQGENILGQLFRTVFKEFSDNLCPVVIDTFADRLQLAGFNTANPKAAELVSQLMKSNRMDTKSGVVHTTALMLGDCYCSVWLDAKGKPHIYTEDIGNIAVRYDEYGEQIIEAVKVLSLGDRLKITRYTAQQIEQYLTKPKITTIPENIEDLIPLDVIPNPYGRVPIFRFSRSSKFGKSELKPVIKWQDALNWSIVQMMIGAESQALPQRWITGVEPQIDPETGQPIPLTGGAGTVWQIMSENAKLGQFEAADLEKFLKVHDNIRREIANVSKTPLHSFMLNSGDFPSGESLRTAEAPLLSKVRDAQIAFGDIWEDVFTFACKLAGIEVDDLEANWIDTTPDNLKELSEIALNMIAAGVPKEQVWKEIFNYTDSQIEDWQSQESQLGELIDLQLKNAE